MNEGATERAFDNNSLSPADKVVIVYLVIVGALVLGSAQRIPYWWGVIALHLLIIGAIIGLAKFNRNSHNSVRARIALLRGWYPLVLIPWTYKELTHLPYRYPSPVLRRWIEATPCCRGSFECTPARHGLDKP